MSKLIEVDEDLLNNLFEDCVDIIKIANDVDAENPNISFYVKCKIHDFYNYAYNIRDAVNKLKESMENK